MANNGFNAATDIFGFGSKWGVDDSQDNASGSVAECPNSDGDMTHRDPHSQRIAPTAKYTLKQGVTSLPALGTVVTYKTKKVMLTKIVITTGQGVAPTAQASGVEVEASATTRRTYSCGTIALSARHKAQDIIGLHGQSVPATITGSTTTFEIDPSFADPKGVIEASDCHNGRVTAQFTHTSGTGAAITAPAVTGTAKVVSEPVSNTSPENDYVTTTYAILDSLTGSETPAAPASAA